MLSKIRMNDPESTKRGSFPLNHTLTMLEEGNGNGDEGNEKRVRVDAG